MDSGSAPVRQVDNIGSARLCETVCTFANKFIVRLGFPPFEAGKEVHHMGVALQHGHGFIATPIQPASATVGPNICSSTCTLASGLVCACHDNIPRDSPQYVSGFGIRSLRPHWVMVFVSVLFVCLWN